MFILSFIHTKLTCYFCSLFVIWNHHHSYIHWNVSFLSNFTMFFVQEKNNHNISFPNWYFFILRNSLRMFLYWFYIACAENKKHTLSLLWTLVLEGQYSKKLLTVHFCLIAFLGLKWCNAHPYPLPWNSPIF